MQMHANEQPVHVRASKALPLNDRGNEKKYGT